LFLCARLTLLKTPGRFHTSLLKATEGNKSARQDPPHQLSKGSKRSAARAVLSPCKCTCPILFYPRARRYDAATIVKIEAGRRNTQKIFFCSCCSAALQRGSSYCRAAVKMPLRPQGNVFMNENEKVFNSMLRDTH
jgi:hypothetical protein